MFYSFISNSYRWVPLFLYSNNAAHTKLIFLFLQYRHCIYKIYLAWCHFGTLSTCTAHGLHITCHVLIGISTCNQHLCVELTPKCHLVCDVTQHNWEKGKKMNILFC